MKFKILVVDDDEQTVKLIVKYFKAEGYDITGTVSPLEALEMIRKTNYMIVISDIMMPEMSGIEFIGKIKDYLGIIQVIMITSHLKLHYLTDCLNNGAIDCIFKPFKDMNELKRAIDGAIDRLVRWQHTLSKDIQVLKTGDGGCLFG